MLTKPITPPASMARLAGAGRVARKSAATPGKHLPRTPQEERQQLVSCSKIRTETREPLLSSSTLLVDLERGWGEKECSACFSFSNLLAAIGLSISFHFFIHPPS